MPTVPAMSDTAEESAESVEGLRARFTGRAIEELSQ